METLINTITNIDDKPLSIISPFNQIEVILSILIDKYREGYAFQKYKYMTCKAWLGCLNNKEAEIAIDIGCTIFITD